MLPEGGGRPHLHDLGNQADGDFARLVSADRQAHRAAERIDRGRRDPGGLQLSAQHLPLGPTADHAQIGRPESGLEDRPEDRQVGGVPHRHAYHHIGVG